MSAKDGGKPSGDDRKARLAAALRDNLKRRKAAARRSEASDPADRAENRRD